MADTVVIVDEPTAASGGSKFRSGKSMVRMKAAAVFAVLFADLGERTYDFLRFASEQYPLVGVKAYWYALERNLFGTLFFLVCIPALAYLLIGESRAPKGSGGPRKPPPNSAEAWWIFAGFFALFVLSVAKDKDAISVFEDWGQFLLTVFIPKVQRDFLRYATENLYPSGWPLECGRDQLSVWAFFSAALIIFLRALVFSFWIFKPFLVSFLQP